MTLIEAIRKARKDKNPIWEWISIDQDNEIFAYNYRPIKSDTWYVNHGKYMFLGKYTGISIPWKKTLIELSEIKVK